MTNGYQTLINHFTANDWKFMLNEEHQELYSGYQGDNAEIRCVAKINEDDDLVECLSIVPVEVPVEKRLLVAELCIRASYPRHFGHFVLNMEDGEIRFHASSFYPKGNLDDSVVRDVVAVGLLVADTYYPAFMSVVFAGASPEAAFQAIEKDL